jgi:predicted alpha/beta hydrolase family esterase
MSKRRFVLIHGWEGYPEEWWRPWLRDKLELLGCEVIVPAMPNTKNPNMVEWVSYLKEMIGNLDEECYLLWHSLGCIAILRYLESLSHDQRIWGAIFIAGFTTNLGFAELDSFFTTWINWEKINKHCSKFIAFHSDNDPHVLSSFWEIFKDNLHAKVI